MIFSSKYERTQQQRRENMEVIKPLTALGLMSGTSMAAPMVTGAAAMVYSARPDIDLLTLKNILIYSAHRLSPLKGRMLSSGMLDVTAALNWGK